MQRHRRSWTFPMVIGPRFGSLRDHFRPQGTGVKRAAIRTPITVRPLSPVDERYLTSSVVWEASRLAVSFVLSAPAGGGGSVGLDMPGISELFESLTYDVPRLRQKIMRPLLGLHAPGW